jgi:hypothetical protein
MAVGVLSTFDYTLYVQWIWEVWIAERGIFE